MIRLYLKRIYFINSNKEIHHEQAGIYSFIGNDLLDIELAKLVGVAVCTANGIKELKKVCHYVTKRDGGDSAVREVIELIMKSRGIKPEDMLK